MPGMVRSLMTRSAGTVCSSRISSTPSRASPTTRTPSTMDSSAPMPERTSSWSSTRTMRTSYGNAFMFMFMGAGAPLGRRCRPAAP